MFYEGGRIYGKLTAFRYLMYMNNKKTATHREAVLSRLSLIYLDSITFCVSL